MKCSRIIRDYLNYSRMYGLKEKSLDDDHNIAIPSLLLREQMRIAAIHNDGILKTFIFSKDNNYLMLSYIQIEDKDIELYPFMFEKQSDFSRIYLGEKTDQSIIASCLAYNENHEIDDTLYAEMEIIKRQCVKTKNGIYSSIDIDSIDIYEEDSKNSGELTPINIDNISIYKEYNGLSFIDINFTYYSIKSEINIDDIIFGKASMPYFGPYTVNWPIKDNIDLSKDVKSTLNKEECTDCFTTDSKINIVNPNQSFTIDNDKLIYSLKYGKYTSYSLIMTKEVFQECYNKWIKPQEEGKNIEKCEVKYEA